MEDHKFEVSLQVQQSSLVSNPLSTGVADCFPAPLPLLSPPIFPSFCHSVVLFSYS